MSGGPGGKEVGRVSVRVVPDTSDFRTRLRQQLAGLNDIKVKVDIDRSDLQRQLDEMRLRVNVQAKLDRAGLRAQLQSLNGSNIKVQAEIDRATLHASLLAFFASHVYTVRARADVDVRIDRNRIQSQLGGLFANLGGAGGGLGGIFTSGGGDFTMIAKVVAVIVAAAPAIALVSSLLAGLPSLLGAAGVMAGTLALGMDGIKRAAEQFTPVLDRMKQSISNTFETELTPIFARLAESMGTWEPTLNRTAVAMSGIVRSFSDVVTSSAGMATINQIIENTNGLLTQMQPGITSLTAGFMNLALHGSGAFQYLGTTFNTLAEDFEQMVVRLADTGAIDSAMKGLSETVTGLGKGFNDIFESGVRAMGTLGPTLGRFLEGLGTGIAKMMPLLTGLSESFMEIAMSVGGAFIGVIEQLTPAILPLLDVFTQLSTSLISSLAPVLTEIAGILADNLLIGLQAMMPVLPVITEAFATIGEALAGALKDNAPAFADAARRIAEAFAKMAPDLAKIIPQLAEMAAEYFPKLIALLPTLISFMTFLGVTVLPLVVKALELLMPVLDKIATGFGKVLDGVKWVADKIQAYIDLCSRTGENQTKLKETITEAWNGIKQAISDAIETIKSFFPGLVSESGKAGKEGAEGLKNPFASLNLFSIGANIIKGLIAGLDSMTGGLISKATTMAGMVKNAFKGAMGINSPSRVFRQYGIWTVQGFNNGIDAEGKQGEKKVMNFAQMVQKAMKDARLYESAIDIPYGIGEKFASDLGFSSSGAIGAAISQGIQGASSRVSNFYVQDLDEAMNKDKTQQKKDALQFIRR